MEFFICGINFFITIILCVYMCLYATHNTHVEVREQPEGIDSLFLSTMWVLGIELRLSGLVASSLTS